MHQFQAGNQAATLTNQGKSAYQLSSGLVYSMQPVYYQSEKTRQGFGCVIASKDWFPSSAPSPDLWGKSIMQMRFKSSIPFYLILAFVFCLSASRLHAQALTLSMSSTPACSLSGTATVNVLNGTPPYTYQWGGPGGSISGSNPTITGLYGGYYWVYVQDANLQWGQAGVSVGMPFNLSVSSVPDICNGGQGSATATVNSGGTPPFSYLWSNGQTNATATGLTVGQYDVTVTDASGCFISSYMDSVYTAYVWNTSPMNITVSHTNATCTGNGTATVSNITGGTPPYTYSWSNGATTNTITNLAVGSYSVTVVDGAGCSDAAWVYISQSGGFTDSISVTPASCSLSNGTITTQVYGGTPPFTYAWSNGATTANLSGLASGSYTVTITDGAGCTLTSTVYVPNSNGFNLSISAVQPTCSTANGSLTANVSGGTPPYSYLWSTSATTQSITGLIPGTYDVTVTDAMGCTSTLFHYLTAQGCEGTIEGRVMADVNADCIFNGADFGMANIIVNMGTYFAVTDSMGYYTEDVLPGSYSVSQGTLPLYYAQTCPVGPISVPSVLTGQVYGGNDFYNTMAANVNDLRVWFYNGPARNNNVSQSVYIYYKNVGSTTLNATVEFTHDALMSMVSGGTGLTSYNSGTRVLTYSLGPVAPGQTGTFHPSFLVPPGTAIGTPYTHLAQILPIAGDAAPLDNSHSVSAQVMGPYDPNRKLVQPDGLLNPAADSLLTYTVEFQNTGNDTAITVVVRDTLDTDLDPVTFELLGSSHAMTWDIDAPGYLTFTFTSIHLPDSNVNEPASHGWLQYRIRLRDNLAIGTQIHNTAAIYFDFNAPIITNTTLNAFGPVAVEPGREIGAGFSLHPNPKATASGTGQVYLTLEESWQEETQVRVMDLSGKLLVHSVIHPEATRQAALELGGLPSGVYMVECSSQSQRAVRKLIVQ
jgi:uncharacterized repeat protein (TIGR01451 family)